MSATSYSVLEFAVSRLRWSLNKPLVCGGRDWGARVYRALQQVGKALEHHINFLEDADGPLIQITDPSLLPFTPEAKRVKELRARHNRLREQVQIVSLQFRDAMLLFPWESGVPEDAIADARAFRLYGVLGSCAADLVNGIEEYRAAEASLLLGVQEWPHIVGPNGSGEASSGSGKLLGASVTERVVNSTYL